MTLVNWINVEDRLPPIGNRNDRVLVWSSGQSREEPYEFAWLSADGRWLIFDLEYDIEIEGVTHWAEPPQDPKKEIS